MQSTCPPREPSLLAACQLYSFSTISYQFPKVCLLIMHLMSAILLHPQRPSLFHLITSYEIQQQHCPFLLEIRFIWGIILAFLWIEGVMSKSFTAIFPHCLVAPFLPAPEYPSHPLPVPHRNEVNHTWPHSTHSPPFLKELFPAC